MLSGLAFYLHALHIFFVFLFIFALFSVIQYLDPSSVYLSSDLTCWHLHFTVSYPHDNISLKWVKNKVVLPRGDCIRHGIQWPYKHYIQESSGNILELSCVWKTVATLLSRRLVILRMEHSTLYIGINSIMILIHRRKNLISEIYYTIWCLMQEITKDAWAIQTLQVSFMKYILLKWGFHFPG